MTACELFSKMSPALAQRVLDEVHSTDKDLYRLALAAVANLKKVRPIFLSRQPKEERHRTMAPVLARPELNMVSGNLLSGWLVKNQQAMLVDFLNALKIPNQNGVVDDLPPTVEDAQLNEAIALLFSKYPADITALYLHAFHGMNDTNWGNLARLLAEDPKLKLG